MNTLSPVPVPMGANPDQPYLYQAWPQWFFREDGRRQIFNSAEEVPEGWYTLDELNELFPGALDNTAAPRAHERASRDDAQEIVQQASVAGQDTGQGNTLITEGGLQVDHPAAGTSDAAEPELREKAEELPRQLTEDQRNALIAKLINDNGQKDLVTELELMNEREGVDEIEFSPTWPKKKLAETIVDNGGPLES